MVERKSYLCKQKAFVNGFYCESIEEKQGTHNPVKDYFIYNVFSIIYKLITMQNEIKVAIYFI
jgi:hypothetical protein